MNGIKYYFVNLGEKIGNSTKINIKQRVTYQAREPPKSSRRSAGGRHIFVQPSRRREGG